MLRRAIITAATLALFAAPVANARVDLIAVPGTEPYTERAPAYEFDRAAAVRLNSSQNAFDGDNFAITAVPEPGVWAMLLLGFGFIGAFLRGQRRQKRLRLKITG